MADIWENRKAQTVISDFPRLPRPGRKAALKFNHPMHQNCGGGYWGKLFFRQSVLACSALHSIPIHLIPAGNQNTAEVGDKTNSCNTAKEDGDPDTTHRACRIAVRVIAQGYIGEHSRERGGSSSTCANGGPGFSQPTVRSSLK